MKTVNKLMAVLVLSLCFFGNSIGDAKIFTNSYMSFDIPDTWLCQIEGSEWICHPQSPNLTQEASIVMTAKEVGPNDTIQSYEDHLKKKLQPVNSSSLSQSLQIKKIQINNMLWMDGLHLGSELNNYYTRYLAAIKNKLAILITFSAMKNQYIKYSPIFQKAINSLNVIVATNEMLSPSLQNSGADSFGGSSGMIGGGMYPGSEDVSDKEDPQGKQDSLYLGLGILIALIIVYILLKLNKKPNRNKRFPN